MQLSGRHFDADLGHGEHGIRMAWHSESLMVRSIWRVPRLSTLKITTGPVATVASDATEAQVTNAPGQR